MTKQNANPSERVVMMSHAEHMALLTSVGRLAHDLRSPIAIMELGLHKIESSHSPKLDVTLMRMALNEFRKIVNHPIMQDRNHSDEHPVYVKSLLEEVIRLKRYEWSNKDCELTLSFESICESDAIHANENEMKRLLSNLLNNALESCEQHADISVRVTKANKTIEICIADNGCGMPVEKIQDFLNGESSKHVGRGLGLSNAKRYIESINGSLSIVSKPGLGTMVLICFA